MMKERAAVALYDTRWWEGLDAGMIVAVQLYEERTIMPTGEFQMALQAALGRPVWTHELANPGALQSELERKQVVK